MLGPQVSSDLSINQFREWTESELFWREAQFFVYFLKIQYGEKDEIPFPTEMRNCMDENHRDKAASKVTATEDKLWHPPLSPKDQKRLARLHRDGFLKAAYKRGGFAGKTLWDWLQLLGVLAVPLVLGIATLLFGIQQANLAQKQHDSDRAIALDQQRETTLKTCMDNIRDLLLNKGLTASKPGDEVRIVARAETLSALRQLDGERKGTLVQFLFEAGLITTSNDTTIIEIGVIIALNGADLSSAALNDADLRGTALNGADLRGAALRGAKLNRAMEGTDAGGADLSDAKLNDADLRGAELYGAELYGAELSGAELSGAKLRGAKLISADLDYATVTKEQLAQAYSLQGTTMPDGSKHP